MESLEGLNQRGDGRRMAAREAVGVSAVHGKAMGRDGAETRPGTASQKAVG